MKRYFYKYVYVYIYTSVLHVSTYPAWAALGGRIAISTERKRSHEPKGFLVISPRMHRISKNCRLKRLKNGEQKRKEHETNHCKVIFWWIIIGWSPPILKRNSWERVDIAGTQKIRQQPWCQMLYCCLEWAGIGIFRWCQLDTTPLTPPKWFETLPENDHISHLCKGKWSTQKSVFGEGFVRTVCSKGWQHHQIHTRWWQLTFFRMFTPNLGEEGSQFDHMNTLF